MTYLVRKNIKILHYEKKIRKFNKQNNIVLCLKVLLKKFKEKNTKLYKKRKVEKTLCTYSQKIYVEYIVIVYVKCQKRFFIFSFLI